MPYLPKNKFENKLPPGLLQPLPLPETAWTHITMDFIEGLPKSDNKDVIWVIVDRFTKYAHFVALSHPFTSEHMVDLFKTHFYRLHGLPSVIVSDHDRIFTSHVWKKLFEDAGVKLHLSTTHHPQSDGQSERVNQCLETYLRCLTFSRPKKWHSLLDQAEWWYNTNFHTSLNMTPYQALYGQQPPMVGEALLPASLLTGCRNRKQAKAALLDSVKASLDKAQSRMKQYADTKRSEGHFKLVIWL